MDKKDKSEELPEKAPKPPKYPDHLWQMSWEEFLAAAEEKHPLVTIEGHLLCSRDRRFEPKTAHGYYLATVKLALKKGLPVPEQVLESNGLLEGEEEPPGQDRETVAESVSGEEQPLFAF